jgi:hypothetical protein
MYRNKQKNFGKKKLFFVGCLSATDEKSRIRNRIRDRMSVVRIRGSGFGSVPKFHGSTTLVIQIPILPKTKNLVMSKIVLKKNLFVKLTDNVLKSCLKISWLVCFDAFFIICVCKFVLSPVGPVPFLFTDPFPVLIQCLLLCLFFIKTWKSVIKVSVSDPDLPGSALILFG